MLGNLVFLFMLEDVVEVFDFSYLLFDQFICKVKGISIFERFKGLDGLFNSITIGIEKP